MRFPNKKRLTLVLIKSPILLFGLMLAAATIHSLKVTNQSGGYQQIIEDLYQRLTYQGPVDTIPGQFKVSDNNQTAAASLAYLLTRFGETVTHASLMAAYNQPPKNLSSEYIVHLASGFGYALETHEQARSLLPTQDNQPIIALLRNSRYVVLHEVDDQAVLFDPMIGSLQFVAADVFFSEWTGTLLRLVPPTLM